VNTMDLPTLFEAVAHRAASSIDLRAEAGQRSDRLAGAPLTFPWGSGYVIVFRHGSAVFLNVEDSEREDMLQHLADDLEDEPQPTERLWVRVDPEVEAEGMVDGELLIRAADLHRMRLVAEVLARTVMLDVYEQQVSTAFDSVGPLVDSLERTGRIPRGVRSLRRTIGEALRIKVRLVGRVEVLDSPETLWEHTDLQPFYHNLAEEYELRDRHQALKRKLDVIHDCAETTLDLLQTRSAFWLEVAIVGLFVYEVIFGLAVHFG
jgi:uncharacterized Rmd1/YagE family protein